MLLGRVTRLHLSVNKIEEFKKQPVSTNLESIYWKILAKSRKTNRTRLAPKINFHFRLISYIFTIFALSIPIINKLTHFAYEAKRIIDTHILNILEKRFSFILSILKFGD